MVEFQYTITDEAGIHARPAGNIVAALKGFECYITCWSDGEAYDVKKLLSFMGSELKYGEVVTVRTEGPDEVEAAEAAKKAFEENL